MFKTSFKRYFYTFGKTEIFEHLLPHKSETYFKVLLKEKQTFYLGIDPTANSLQIGNLFPLIALLRIWRSGHNIITLIGGATGQIGDPTGRIIDRVEISDTKIHENCGNIISDIDRIINNFTSHYLTNENIGEYKLLNNRDWYKEMNLLAFTSKILKHFRFHDIKNKRSFEGRLASENTMNMSEFIYPFLQAYDWLHLYRNYNCRIQLGGDDQQGNMQLGQILIDQTERTKVYGLTVPLFSVNGEKVGKSTAKSHLKLWLNPKVQSPYSLYSSIFHVSNGIIINNCLLKKLTLLEDEEIKAILSQHQAKPNENILQTTLADQVVKLVHGPDVLNAVKSIHHLFSTSSPESINDQLVSINNSNIIWNNISSVPHIRIDSNSDGVTISDCISGATGNSSADLKGNIKFNGQHVENNLQQINGFTRHQKICGVLQIGSNNKWVVLQNG